MEAPELNDYREHLLEALDDQPRRVAEERLSFLQVLVNHERVGGLDCSQPNAAFAFTARERSIQHLEIRTEAGVLIGGCVAPEAGQKTLTVRAGKGTLAIQVQNHFDGGSLRVQYQPAPHWWAGLAGAMGLNTGASAQASRLTPVWTMTAAFAQLVLAVGVVALLAERVPSWMGWDDRAHQLEE